MRENRVFSQSIGPFRAFLGLICAVHRLVKGVHDGSEKQRQRVQHTVFFCLFWALNPRFGAIFGRFCSTKRAVLRLVHRKLFLLYLIRVRE